MLYKTAIPKWASISAYDDTERCPQYITELKQMQVAKHCAEYNPII